MLSRSIIAFTIFLLFNFWSTWSLAQTNTTTTGPPTVSSTTIPPNSAFGTCSCDLTRDICDVNCCCDPDCSSNDRITFTTCTTSTTTNSGGRSCVATGIVFRFNTPIYRTVVENGLFCVYIDNNIARNYYEIPRQVQDNVTFNSLAKKYGRTLSPATVTPTAATPYYRVGDKLKAIYNDSIIGILSLPKSLFSDVCDDRNPVLFYVNDVSQCNRHIKNIMEECSSSSFLSAASYYQNIRVAKLPSALNTSGNVISISVNDFVNINVSTSILCIDKSTGLSSLCSYALVPSPTYHSSNNSCSNVLKELTYNILTNGSLGIVQLSVTLTLSNLEGSKINTTYFRQKFSVSYTNNAKANIFRRSGNPGYVVDQPLLAGKVGINAAANNQIILYSGDSKGFLTVISPTASGFCVSEQIDRTPILFGKNMRSGCLLSVTLNNLTNNCQLIREQILNGLIGTDIPTHVAMYGNSAVENVSDWVTILRQNVPQAPSNELVGSSGICQNVVMGIHIRILWSYTGSLANPQAKIIGVSISYDDPRNLAYECVGSSCESSSHIQKYEITTTVSFFDVSEKPASELKSLPRVEVKMPYDFFYPFLSSCTDRSCNQMVLILITASAVIFEQFLL